MSQILQRETGLDPAQCLELCELARPHLTPSLVQYGTHRSPNPELRQSENVRLRGELEDLDLARLVQELALVIAQELAEIEGQPRPEIEQVEPVDVVHYPEGGFFGRHHDGPHRGQTVLIMLEPPIRGGRTVFPDRREAFALKTGEAIAWTNDPTTFHASEVVDEGEKWVAVVWVLNG